MKAAFTLRPISLRDANAFVETTHRHHKKVRGHKFSLSAMNGGELAGVIIVGRPVARMLDDGETLEVTRCCTDGSRNACSFLYSAAWRVVKAMGYRRLISYTLPEEGGASLRGAGWRLAGEAGGGQWSRPSRPRNEMDSRITGVKHRWEVIV